jgi:hypothetical protein
MPLPDDTRQRLLADLHALRSTVEISGSAQITGVVVGVNLGRIIYGADPTDVQREQLTRYLRRLAAKLQRLPLRGLAARLDEGSGIALSKVYVLLATLSHVDVAAGSAEQTEQYFEKNDPLGALKPAYDPALVPPPAAIVRVHHDLAKKNQPRIVLARSKMATEAVQQHPRLVLLGDPGGGKSTFLRHLAWALAQRGLDSFNDDTALFGWNDTARLLPVLLPLRTLAGRISAEGAAPATVSAALRDEMAREYDARHADELLDQALASGAALLFDGLDEVPLDAIPGVSADRPTTLRAVRSFAELHSGARVVLTCRVRAFTEALHAELGWPTETIAPLTLGQIRHFVANWYAALIEHGAITRDLGEAQQQALIAAIIGTDRLHALANTPLLLTMMALVFAERGELLPDRPLLYERILEQLLGQWDQHKGGQRLTDVLDAPNLRSDDLRPILDALSYQAHASATSADGRGRLAAKDLRSTLAEFLATVRVAGAWEAAGRCLAYFNERSGLLLPEDDGQSYVLAHMTLQEHGAGRHMLLQPNAVALVMRHRSDEHWREPIALGLGVVQRLYAPLADRIDRILTELIDPDERGQPKPRERWYRDLILAAELGVERDWNLLRALINVERIQRDLRRGLVELLHDPAQPLAITERMRAGFLLGDLGDPRFPVTIKAWRHAIISASAGKTDDYFCPIPLREGSRALWIARYPITNAQLQEWTPPAQLPPRPAPDANFKRPNQPAAGVPWHLASAFCAWLSQQTGATIRLPSEAEWEAAARGNDGRRYPWGNKRLRDRAATKEDHNLRGWPYPLPVGCYPAGASAVGALDMAGNIWEWTSDVWQPDAASAQAKAGGQLRVLRGGGHLSKKRQTLATARIGLAPGVGFANGFRVVLEIADRSPED